MSIKNRRTPQDGVRRIPLTVNLSPDVHLALQKIENGNRSAAIEKLVKLWQARKLQEIATDA